MKIKIFRGKNNLRPVFISYNREDSLIAQSIRQSLRAEGLNVWWDEEIRTGDQWEKRINSVLSRADTVLVLWSITSANSEWVRYEASIGRFNGNLTQVLIDKSEIPKPFSSIQAENLSNWNKREDDPNFIKLLQGIRAIQQRRTKEKRLSHLRLFLKICLVVLISFVAGWILSGRFGKRGAITADSNPVELTILNKELGRNIKNVIIPTFTDTFPNYGGATDGDYLDGLAYIFTSKLSKLYKTKFVRLNANREPGFETAFQLVKNEIVRNQTDGILVGSVLDYKDERADIKQKAIVSIVIELFDMDGKKIWSATGTISDSSAEHTGSPQPYEVKATELFNRLSSDIVNRLTTD